ncbi:MAG: hypothetical protein M3256_28010 [Actinomycetota bacterium]|nr:hypothetical protein [Actinomycetota bacterium]
MDPNGSWTGLPYQNGAYTQKVFWWSHGYLGDSLPNLTVMGVRLDGPAAPLVASRANGAFGEDIGSAMLVGIDIAAAGCWAITGQFQGAALTFVVWIPA